MNQLTNIHYSYTLRTNEYIYSRYKPSIQLKNLKLELKTIRYINRKGTSLVYIKFYITDQKLYNDLRCIEHFYQTAHKTLWHLHNHDTLEEKIFKSIIKPPQNPDKSLCEIQLICKRFDIKNIKRNTITNLSICFKGIWTTETKYGMYYSIKKLSQK